MSEPNDITLVENAVHNPHEPRHFMQIVPARAQLSASLGSKQLAQSVDAVVVKEVGRDIYDPMVYFPRSDVDESVLSKIDKTTHCPVKGNTEYFDLVIDGERVAEAAWSYVDGLIDGAGELQDRIAFDPSKVVVQ